MTDEEILRLWNMLREPRKIDARVYACAVSAYENNGEIETGRAVAVLNIVWPGVDLGAVPSEIRGRTANQNNNRNRQDDFNRLIQLIRSESDRPHLEPSEHSGKVRPDANPPAYTPGSSETGGIDSEMSVASDLEHPPAERVVTTVTRVVRDTELAKRIKKLHSQLCQLCGQTVQLADGTGYAEGHHLQPLGKPHDGPDVAENIVCLCPNHHAACDLGAIRLAATDLRPAVGHMVGQQFIDYHNRVVYRGAK